MFARMKIQQMLQVCGAFPPMNRFLAHTLLCCSVCIYKEAIKTPDSIGVRREEFLYKHQSHPSHQDSTEARFQ